MDFRTITNITTPVGNLVRIRRKSDNVIIWEKNTGIEVIPTWEYYIKPYNQAYYPYYKLTGLTEGKTYTLEFKNTDFEMPILIYEDNPEDNLPYVMVTTVKESSTPKILDFYNPGGVVDYTKIQKRWYSLHIVNPQPITFTAPAATTYIQMATHKIAVNPRWFSTIGRVLGGTAWETNPELYTIIVKEV